MKMDFLQPDALMLFGAEMDFLQPVMLFCCLVLKCVIWVLLTGLGNFGEL
jgi:hypothetical protein